MNMVKWVFSSVFALLLAGCFQGVKSRTETKAFDFKTVALDEQTYPVVIIGGGIAGLTAANYLAQGEISCIVIEGEKPGGALAQSDSVRNWPGVINLPGAQITKLLKQQVFENGVGITQEKVVSFESSSWPYTLEVQHCASGEKRTIKALTCVIATGAEPYYLNIPGERGDNGYWGRGVTNCAVCDGSLYRDKQVAVVGGGDSAILEASYLAGIAKQVTIFVRKDAFKARDKRRMTEALARPNITVVFNTEVRQILGDQAQVTHLELFNNKTNETQTVPMDGLFLATGSKPNTDLFKGKVKLDQDGYIMLAHEGQKTSLPSVWAAGDVHDRKDRQAITSAAAGCKAALEIKQYFDDLGFDAKKIHDIKKIVKNPVPVATKEKEMLVTKPISIKNTQDAHTGEKNLVGIKKTQNAHKNEENLIDIATVGQFEKIVLAHPNDPLIIDFYATWCGPCKTMEPIFYALAQRFKNIQFVKVNVDKVDAREINARIGSKSPIMGVPTFVFVRYGRYMTQISGSQDQASFENQIKKIFSLE